MITFLRTTSKAATERLCNEGMPGGKCPDLFTYLGGISRNQFVCDCGNGIAVDPGGQAYITSQAKSTDFPTKDAFQNAFAGGFEDAFVTKSIYDLDMGAALSAGSSLVKIELLRIGLAGENTQWPSMKRHDHRTDQIFARPCRARTRNSRVVSKWQRGARVRLT
ncbi:MAG: hypothetical protein ACJ74Z_03545 [Bryobacteraceae bacterium]